MIAEFAALAQIAISAYGAEEQYQDANQASALAQDQQRAATGVANQTATQAFQGAQYDEQWMQMKQLSQQLYGAKQIVPPIGAGPVAGPTLR